MDLHPLSRCLCKNYQTFSTHWTCPCSWTHVFPTVDVMWTTASMVVDDTYLWVNWGPKYRCDISCEHPAMDRHGTIRAFIASDEISPLRAELIPVQSPVVECWCFGCFWSQNWMVHLHAFPSKLSMSWQLLDSCGSALVVIGSTYEVCWCFA